MIRQHFFISRSVNNRFLTRFIDDCMILPQTEIGSTLTILSEWTLVNFIGGEGPEYG
jgi:hypothetical protein